MPPKAEPRAARRDPDLLEAYLAEHAIDCPVCGYGLHRLTEPRCPECAAELSLTVAATKNGAIRFAAAPTRLEAVARTALRATKIAIEASRDAFAEHHSRSALLDTFAQTGLVVGIVLHGVAAVWLLADPRLSTVALALVMLLVVAACGGLFRISVEAGAWVANQSASIRCGYALGGWWWTVIWVFIALLGMF